MRLSSAVARRVIAHAHFGGAPLTSAAEALDRLGALQLDPISRVERAHRLTTIARMRPTRRIADPAALDAGLWEPGPAVSFEGVVHAMCLLPAQDWPLWRERRQRYRERLERSTELHEEIDRVLEATAASTGGVLLRDLERDERTRGWSYSHTKMVAERLVHAGGLVVTERRGGLRVYDLPERRIPAPLLDARPDPDQVDLVFARRALAVAGLGAVRDLAAMWMRPVAQTRRALDALVAAGEAVEIEVDGWQEAAVASPAALAVLDAARQRRVRFIGPFDPFLNRRTPALRAFDLDYRLEAYVPKEKRVHGPYALSVLVDDALVALVDLRADRRAGVLEVVALTPVVTRAPLARIRAALPGFARQLGLTQVRRAERD